MEQEADKAKLVSTRIQWAEMLMGRGRNQEALEYLQDTLTIENNHALTQAVMAVCLYHANDPRGLELAKAAVAADPGLGYAYYATALCLWQMKDEQGALGAIQTALKLEPYRAGYLAEHSRFLRELGEMDDALGMINTAIMIEPGAEGWFVRRSSFLGMMGRRAEALADAETAVRLNPENAETQAALGEALMDVGRYEAAVNPLREALRLEPTLPYHQEQLLRALSRRTWLKKLMRPYDWAFRRIDRWLKAGKYAEPRNKNAHEISSRSAGIGGYVFVGIFFVLIYQFEEAKRLDDYRGVWMWCKWLASPVVLIVLLVVLHGVLQGLVNCCMLRHAEVRKLMPPAVQAGAIGIAGLVATSPLIWVLVGAGWNSGLTVLKLATVFYAGHLVFYSLLVLLARCWTRERVVQAGTAALATGMMLAAAVIVERVAGGFLAGRIGVVGLLVIVSPVVWFYVEAIFSLLHDPDADKEETSMAGPDRGEKIQK